MKLKKTSKFSEYAFALFSRVIGKTQILPNFIRPERSKLVPVYFRILLSRLSLQADIIGSIWLRLAQCYFSN